ncbi:unnamed protein product [Gadus morhua 'NCC']
MGRKPKQLGRPLNIKDTPINTKLIQKKNKYRRPLTEKINIYQPLLEETELEEIEVPTAQGSLNNVEPVQFDALRSRAVWCGQLNFKNLSHPSTTISNTNGRASSPMPTFESPEDDPIVLGEALESWSASSDLEYDTSASHDVSDGIFGPLLSTTCTSSLPTPEVFRHECDKGSLSVLALRPLDFSIEEELLHPKVKNSTLLDVSNANNIHMEQPIDLSFITGTKVESRRGCNHFVSDWNFKKISPKTRPSIGAPSVEVQQKVHFHRPVFDVTLRPTDATQDARAAFQTSIKEPMGKGKAEIFDEQSKPHFPRRPGQDPPRILNFTCLEDRDAFFQRLRDRYTRLRSVPLFLQTYNGVPIRDVLF